jgi:hypothetical protein
MWSFSESIAAGAKYNQDAGQHDENTTADEKAPFKLTIEERVIQKMAEH